MSRLKRKIAIVAGGGAGVGEAIARRFSAEGVKVAVADIDGNAAQAVAARMPGAAAIQVDVADSDAVRAAVARIVATVGAPDILVNNSGVNVFGEPLATTEVDWRRRLSVDLEGAWNFSREALPHMLAKGRGAIVNIASNHSLQVIRDTISPGYIDTPSTRRHFASQPDPPAARADAERRQPLRRLGRPEEIAAIAAFLASHETGMIIGANIVADGGVTIRMYE